MDNLVKGYQKIVKELLEEYRKSSSSDDIELQTIFDEVQNRFQLVALGWQGKKRVHGCLIHIDIKNGKVWLQHDSTDAEIAKSLVEMGIPKENIVLGFQPEHYRKHSGFATN